MSVNLASSRSVRWLSGILLGAGVALLLLALPRMTVLGWDWYGIFYPTVQGYLSGATRLYDDGVVTGVFKPPWVLLVLIPFAALGEVSGQIVLNLASLGILIWVARAFAPPVRFRPLWIALACGSLFTFELVSLGQVGAWVALGVWLLRLAFQRQSGWLWALGLTFVTIKPQVTPLVALAALIWLRWWPKRASTQALAGLGVLLGISFVVAGLEWPLRWWSYVHWASPPGWIGSTATVYQLAERLAMPLWAPTSVAIVTIVGVLRELIVRGPRTETLILATAASAVVTPFVRPHDFTVLMAVCWPSVAARNWPLALGVYTLSLTPLLRGPLGGGYWLDATFSVALFAAVLAWYVSTPRERVPPLGASGS